MDEPARKRRKTASPENGDRPSSPLKKPPRRPSFASPTKASLSRFHSNLLRPASSGSATSAQDSRANILARGRQARSELFGDSDELAVGENLAQNRETQAVAGAQQPAPGSVLYTTPRKQRPGARRRRSIPLDDDEEQEVDLPTSSSHRALEQQDTPRRGVLFSSPTKRPSRVQVPTKPSSLKLTLREEDGGVPEKSTVKAPKEKQFEDDVDKGRRAPDPAVEEKKREKERLLRELQELEGDITRCVEEIHNMQHQPAAYKAHERDSLITFINKISNSNTSEVEEPTPISTLLCSFLPFNTFASLPHTKAVDQDVVPSHRPLELEDPLPYLQMFTSLKFTSHLSLPEARGYQSSTAHARQKHTIDITGPQKLFTSTLTAVLDTVTHQVDDLEVSRLSGWAEPELGGFARTKAQAKDLSSVCWAMNSYWEMAKKRAQYWQKCEKTFPHLFPGRALEDTENISQTANKMESGLSRKELHRHLGRDVLVLEDRLVLLKLTWRIGFDWTGEAESEISLEPAIPSVWSEADERNSFKQIPETFNSLLEARGVFEATKTMVTLLFATE